MGIGWSHLDSAMPSIAWATVAGIGAAEPTWIEAVAQFEGVWAGPISLPGYLMGATGAALLDGRWATLAVAGAPACAGRG
jgi:hypothetical protein